MKTKILKNGIAFLGVKDLDLAQTLDCGQAFRWEENEDGSFSGVVRKKAVKVYLQDDTLSIIGAEKSDDEMWYDYFDLSLDYGKVRKELSKINSVMADAAKYAPGIRILKQEPKEALLSFIISQNNNIARIKKIVKSFCQNFGEKVENDIFDNAYAFPDVERVCGLSREDLSVIKAGFRDRYILDASNKLCSGEIDLEKIRTMEYDKAQSELMKITGVGKKVADCTLLYGLHRLESFPLDVWMKRAMAVLFDNMGADVFGEYGGIAQQYIFHYSRMHKELFEQKEKN